MKSDPRKPSVPAVQYAVKLLSARGYSERKLREKLKTRGYDSSEISEAVAKLIGKHLLDDRKFAEDFVRARLAVRPRGKTVLVRDLISRGIAPSLANAVVSDQVPAEDEENLARELVRRKASHYASFDSDVRMRRLYALLARRGFRPDTIRKVLGNLAGNLEE